MTIEEFNNRSKTGHVPISWIGQGWGYKDKEFDWANGNPTDIIYIPEYGYDWNGEQCYVERENAYSKEDFIDLCNGDEGRALFVFEAVDWQFPSSFYNEVDWEDDVESKVI